LGCEERVVGKGDRTRQARQKLEQVRAQQRAQERRRRAILGGAAGVAVAAVAVVIAIVAITSGGGSTGGKNHEVMPAAIPAGTPVVLPAALTVPNTTGISGVVAYDTTGWPTSSRNGPANRALGHTHVPGPVTYSVTPPVGGDHNATWMNCGVYDKPVPTERAVHNLEHGAVWINYQPSLPQAEVNTLRAFFGRQTVISPGGASGSRYLDLTPYPGLPAPIVASSWGFQLRLTSPTDPRLQQFVTMFRASQKLAPEYGAPCTGGTGTPLQT
jgi:hypothetical protein